MDRKTASSWIDASGCCDMAFLQAIGAAAEPAVQTHRTAKRARDFTKRAIISSEGSL